MPKVWVVKASGGERAEAFRKGGYASVGFGITEDLSEVTDTKTIERFCPEARTNRHAVSQVHRFLNEIRPGDHIITPAKQGRLFVGVVGGGERQGKFFEPSPGSQTTAIIVGVSSTEIGMSTAKNFLHLFGTQSVAS